MTVLLETGINSDWQYDLTYTVLYHTLRTISMGNQMVTCEIRIRNNFIPILLHQAKLFSSFTGIPYDCLSVSYPNHGF